MSVPPVTGPWWSTSSFGDAADTSPGELSLLGAHVARCRGTHGHWIALRCGAENFRSFVDARRVTALVVVAVLVGVALRWA